MSTLDSCWGQQVFVLCVSTANWHVVSEGDTSKFDTLLDDNASGVYFTYSFHQHFLSRFHAYFSLCLKLFILTLRHMFYGNNNKYFITLGNHLECQQRIQCGFRDWQDRNANYHLVKCHQSMSVSLGTTTVCKVCNLSWVLSAQLRNSINR